MSTLSSPDIGLRPEKPGDVAAIRQVNEAAFDTATEAQLVDDLRAADAVTLSVVAVLGATSASGGSLASKADGHALTSDLTGGEVVGHALFTPVTVTSDAGDVPLLGLGPVAVTPSRQRQGIGTFLISECLEYLRHLRHPGVVVVGEPSFYRRFGFIQADRWGLACELGVPAENFLALELRTGHLGGISGTVHYRPEFAGD